MAKFFCLGCGHGQESYRGAGPSTCTACDARGITFPATWSLLPLREQTEHVQSELSYMDRRMLRSFGIAEN